MVDDDGNLPGDKVAGINICYYSADDCSNYTVHHNVVSGAPTVGIFMYAHEKGSDPLYDHNIAHSIQGVGGFTFRNKQEDQTVSEVKNFKAYKCLEQGFLTLADFEDFEGRNIQTADCKTGITIQVAHKYLAKSSLHDSIIHGDTDVPDSICTDKYGLYLPKSLEKPFPSQTKPFSKNKRFDTKNKDNAEFAIFETHNVTIQNFKSENLEGECTSQKQYGIKSHDTAPDYSSINMLQDTIFKDVHSDAFAQISSPKPGWQNSEDCGVDFPCTMPENVYISLAGSVTEGSIQPTLPAGDRFFLLPDN